VPTGLPAKKVRTLADETIRLIAGCLQWQPLRGR
jgi:hypothetical protein